MSNELQTQRSRVAKTGLGNGLYLLILQAAPIESDAAPSRPLIFPLHPAP